jgi:hypothetical protein
MDPKTKVYDVGSLTGINASNMFRKGIPGGSPSFLRGQQVRGANRTGPSRYIALQIRRTIEEFITHPFFIASRLLRLQAITISKLMTVPMISQKGYPSH